MSQLGLAENWYRIAELKPRLRPQARVHRQRHRGRLWYVLQDRQSGRFFRISAAANLVLCLMNGRRTMAQIWDLTGRRYGPERPTQDEIVRLLAQLHQADLLQGEAAPDMAELERRAARRRRGSIVAAIKSPMAVRMPLFDPEVFLDRTLPIVRPLFSLPGFLLWLALIVAGAVLAGMSWPELSAGVADRVFAADNIVILALTYPIVKALHELGHAYATKVHGGEIHEMGVLLLVFFPMPYVDASASSAFRRPGERALVGAAGIMVELALAAVAMIVWLQLEPGFLRAVAFNVMLIGGVSTVLFNGNPLLRFDGYYVLSDLIEIPNLDARAKRYLLYLVQRHLFGVRDLETPVQGPGEASWFIVYGIAAFLYRASITLGIALFVAGQFFIIGVLLAVWSVIQMFGLPLVKGAHWLMTSAQLRYRRPRAVAVSSAVVAALAGLLFAVPVPYATVGEGVVWVPDTDIVRAGGEGFVQSLLAAPGSEVAAGQPVLQLEDPVAAAQLAVKRAELAVLEHRFTAVNMIDLVQARLVREQRDRAAANLARAEQRTAALVVRAPDAGRFVVPDGNNLIGRFIREGDLIGYVISENDIGIRVVVPQADIDPVRARVNGVTVRLTDEIDEVHPARIVRQTPAALDRPPAPALAPEGGGPMLLDPTNPKLQRPLDRFFEIELKLDGKRIDRIGGRVFARFDHGAEALAWRGLRAARQLFLRMIHV